MKQQQHCNETNIFKHSTHILTQFTNLPIIRNHLTKESREDHPGDAQADTEKTG